MQDRLKFRAWDIEEKKYNEVIGLGVCRSCLPDGYVKNETQIFEQCTGLKDKNGKFIYEGDICSIKGYYHDCEQQEDIEVKEIEKVESLERFFGEAMVKGIYTALGCDTLEVEIIGNIHENPDLL